VCEDDVLLDAMYGAEDIDRKKLLMRYRRLKQEMKLRDPIFSNKVLQNLFPCVRKFGTLFKR